MVFTLFLWVLYTSKKREPLASCKSKRTGDDRTMNKLIRYGLGVAIPPVGVFLTYGVSSTFFLNIFLTLLAWLPGSIHAVWAIAKHYENASLEAQSSREINV